MLIDLSAQRIFYQFCAAVFIIATHGFFLALSARLLGDRGPQFDGRQTLNPFAHSDPIGALTLVLTQFGWVRPVALDANALKGGKLGPLLVAVAALAATLVVAWMLWQSRPLVFQILTANSFGVTVIGIIETAARMSVSFVILNLLPILPLSAGHLLLGLVPGLAQRLNQYRPIISLVLGVMIFLWVASMLRGPSQALARALFGQ